MILKNAGQENMVFRLYIDTHSGDLGVSWVRGVRGVSSDIGSLKTSFLDDICIIAYHWMGTRWKPECLPRGLFLGPCYSQAQESTGRRSVLQDQDGYREENSSSGYTTEAYINCGEKEKKVDPVGCS